MRNRVCRPIHKNGWFASLSTDLLADTASQPEEVLVMSLCLHELIPTQCAWCLKLTDVTYDEPWERHDYVRTSFERDTDKWETTSEVRIGEVSQFDIHGAAKSMARLGQRR